MKKNLSIIAASAAAALPVLLVASDGNSIVRVAALAYGIAIVTIAKRTAWAQRLGDAIESLFPDVAIK